MDRPASLTDLDSWSVYADWLQQCGDPRGAVIALDLALPPAPDAEALRAFQELHHTAFPERARLAIAHALGQPRALEVGPDLERPATLEPLLAEVRELLATSPFVEELSLARPFEDGAVHWRRVLAAIPSRCRRLTLVCREVTDATARDLLAHLPPTVRDLTLQLEKRGAGRGFELEALVSDRFASLELVDLVMSRDMAAAFQRTQTLQLRVQRADHDFRHPRYVLNDAAFMRRSPVHAFGLPRWTLVDLVRRHGPVPHRAQAARTLAESYLVTPMTAQLDGPDVVRRAGRWFLWGGKEHAERRMVDGAMVNAGALVPLDHGSRVRFTVNDGEWIFLAHDATAEVRAAMR